MGRSHLQDVVRESLVCEEATEGVGPVSAMADETEVTVVVEPFLARLTSLLELVRASLG